MQAFTCTGLRVPHMMRVEIADIDFDSWTYHSWEDGTYIQRNITDLKHIEISNRGRIHPDFTYEKTTN